MTLRKLRHFILAVLVVALLPAAAFAVESNEFAISFQGGAMFLDGKLGVLFSPDVAYGAGTAYGLTDHFALVADFLYSEHQSSDEKKYGRLRYTQGAASLGFRAGHTFSRAMPYIEAAPLLVFSKYRASYPAGSETGTDSLNSHGFGGTGAVGLDVFVSDGATVGLAGRAGVARTDMNFATGADLYNTIRTYTFYAGLVRLNLLF